jgi:hypothetical protein
MRRFAIAAALGALALSSASVPAFAAQADVSASASATLLGCLETIARTFHVRIVDSSGFAAPIACVPASPTLDHALDRLLHPHHLDWRRLDDGTVEVIAAQTAASMQLPALDIEGDPLPDVQRPEHPLATPLVERATASTSLDRRWLDSAPLLGFNQIGWFAPNVYGAGQSLAIRGTERDTDYFPALTITFDGIDLGTRLLDDELVPLEDVTSLDLARGPRTFEAGEGAQAGAIALKTAAPAAEPATSLALGAGNHGARDGAASWSGPLGTTDIGATIALDRHELPGFVRQAQVPAANVAKRDNDFGRLKLRYAPDFGVTAQLAALALSGDSSDRQVVPPSPVPGHPLPAFDLFDRDSYATDPVVASTHARGAAGFVRYDAAHWAVDAHASITTITRDVAQFPDDTRWSDHELRRREGISLSDSLAPDWTIVAGLERDHMATAFYTPIARQTILNYFATSTDSASFWAEHAWNSTWTTGLGVRWVHERATVFANEDRGYGYRVPIPLAVIEWHPWTDHVFSASYGTGYRSGGQVNSGVVTYRPERNENLELAWRAQWFAGALRTTLSAFDGSIRDRFTYSVSSAGGDPILARVRERGVELELDADLSQRWRVRAGFGALSSHYSSVSYQFGDPTSEAPPQTAVLGLRYGLDSGWYGALDAYRAAAAQYYNPPGRLPSYDVVSMRAGYRTPHWDAALIASNALDEHYAERVQLSAANQIGYRLGDPRRVEMRVKLSW